MPYPQPAAQGCSLGSHPGAFTQDRGLGVTTLAAVLGNSQHLVNKGPHVFICARPLTMWPGLPHFVPHTSRSEDCSCKLPRPAPLPGLLVCSLRGSGGWSRLNTPHRALASDFAELTLAGEASPCSSRHLLLPPPSSSILLPATGRKQLTCLCTHPPHHPITSHSACWSPPHREPLWVHTVPSHPQPHVRCNVR